MEKGTITNLNIEDFKQHKMVCDYVDDDFIVATDLINLPHSKDYFVRVNFFLIILCEEGCIQLDVNGKTYLLEKDYSLVCLPTMILSRTMLSPEHKVTIMGFSTQFLQRILKRELDTTNIMRTLFKNPIHYVDRENEPPAFHHYGELVLAKIKNPDQRYHKDILQHLFSALFFEMLSEIPLLDPDANEVDESLNRTTNIFRRFMRELAKDNGRHRSVNYYAERLCYSPKYVSSIIKQVSGRTALDWINEATIELIKHALKHSEKSMKELAEEFNFPNQSFFGKYVKAHLGMSPVKYRETAE